MWVCICVHVGLRLCACGFAFVHMWVCVYAHVGLRLCTSVLIALFCSHPSSLVIQGGDTYGIASDRVALYDSTVVILPLDQLKKVR